MSKLSSILLLSIFLVVGSVQSFSAEMKETRKSVAHDWQPLHPFQRAPQTTQGDILFFSDVDTAVSDFQSVDGTDVGIKWHTVGLEPPGGTLCRRLKSKRWWCGETCSPGGYGDLWYQVLITPPIFLPDTSSLTVQANWAVEASGDTCDYDGWTAWISTDSGANFKVLEPVGGYSGFHGTSWAYQLHGVFIPGGVPVFNDKSGGWIDVEFPLHDYIDHEVVLRVTFVSDECVSTSGYPGGCRGYRGLYGVWIDNFLVKTKEDTLFLDNAEDFVRLDSLQITRGDHWNLSEDDFHSPPHSWHIDPDSIWGLRTNWLQTPWIHIPEDGYIEASFWMKNDMPDSDGNGDGVLEDYFEVSVTVNDTSWIKMFYDYSRGGVDSSWMLWDDDRLFNGTLKLDEWRGDSLRLRWLFIVDANDDGGTGQGAWIDDVLIIRRPCEGLRGDPTGNGIINVLDVVIAVNHILGNHLLLDDAFCRGDCTGDGVIDVLDALAIVNVFLGVFDACPDSSGACKPVVTPETMELLQSLQSYLLPENFTRFMALVKQVQIPTEYHLAQNYPNPFNPETTIEYTLPEAAKAKVEVYNLLGHLIEVLIDSGQEPGSYSVNWDASDMSSGVYFYRLTAGRFSETKRMVLIK